MVKEASESKRLNEKLARYLLNSRHALDHRLAVVSALGWDINGQRNAKIFSDMALNESRTWFYSRNWKQLPPDQLIILAYLGALDDYFDTKDELKQARMAQEKDPNNASIAVIGALIEGQGILELKDTQEWKRVWTIAKPALEKRDPPRLRPKALLIIRKYMLLYRE